MSVVYYWPCDLASVALSRVKEALTALGGVRWSAKSSIGGDGDGGGSSSISSKSNGPPTTSLNLTSTLPLSSRVLCEFKSFHYGNVCTILLCSTSFSPHQRTLLVRNDDNVCFLNLESSIDGLLSRMHEGALATPRQVAHLDGELGHGTGPEGMRLVLGTLTIGNAMAGVILLMEGLTKEGRDRWRMQVLPPQYFPLLEPVYQDDSDVPPKGNDEHEGDSLIVVLSTAINKVFFS